MANTSRIPINFHPELIATIVNDGNRLEGDERTIWIYHRMNCRVTQEFNVFSAVVQLSPKQYYRCMHIHSTESSASKSCPDLRKSPINIYEDFTRSSEELRHWVVFYQDLLKLMTTNQKLGNSLDARLWRGHARLTSLRHFHGKAGKSLTLVTLTLSNFAVSNT